MRPPAAVRRHRVLLSALAGAALLALLFWWWPPLGWAVLALLTLLVLVATLFVPTLGVALLDDVTTWLRGLYWAADDGRFHSFGGVSLAIEERDRAMWIAGADLQRVLHTRDDDPVLAARVPGRWRRDDSGRLWLRIDAVVEHLETAPGRMEPRRLRLVQYLKRQVLFPHAERQRRA